MKINDVAKLAEVSLATVSRVINGKKVKESTRVKVESAIKELNYTPNFMASSLHKSQRNMILIIVPELSNPYYSSILQGIEVTAKSLGYNIILGSSYSSEKQLLDYINLLNTKLVDGIILMERLSREKISEKIKDENVLKKIVQCSEYIEENSLSYVTIDHEKAAYEAIHHLLSIGKKEIYFFSMKNNYTYSILRRNGVIRALKDNGLELKKENEILLDNLSIQEAHKQMDIILNNRKIENIGIFTVSDIIAIGILKSLNNKKILIPKNVAVIGFDNIDFSMATSPALTTISQPGYELGVESVKCLVRKITDIESKPEKIILSHELIVRETTN
ncbi:LacI family DNA-binding transcriptional regulator [Cetobacterium somerae]|uniref:LacI family DNA-binding transcriptional regulator n=1 Tax=Cetobacterium somerae TaxID=188913 RepID=UPI00211E2F3B|nr:LacI family DNA-binding transcriptional regulator [Cetobacterium somerae]MCQ9627172.1 LacI family DNA-binding transcriptional regulator [Cetobacterium somerae]